MHQKRFGASWGPSGKHGASASAGLGMHVLQQVDYAGMLARHRLWLALAGMKHIKAAYALICRIVANHAPRACNGEATVM